MVSKSIKHMLLFITLCILLIGIVSATDVESNDTTIDTTPTISEKTSNQPEIISDVKEDVVKNDVKKDVIKDNNKEITKDSKTEDVKTESDKTGSKGSTDISLNVSVNGEQLLSKDYNINTDDLINDITQRLNQSDKNFNITNIKALSETLTPILNLSTKDMKQLTNNYTVITNDLIKNITQKLDLSNKNINITNIKTLFENKINPILNLSTKDAKQLTKNYTEITNDLIKKITLINSTYVNSMIGCLSNAVNNLQIIPIKESTYIKLNKIDETPYNEYAKISGYYYYQNNTPIKYTTMRIKINGKLYTAKTDGNGLFTYNYLTEKVWKNTVTVSYPGNKKIKAAIATETFNVKITKPIDTYIKLNKINDVNYGKCTTISGYYLYGNGQPLTQTTMKININGEQYTAKTNNKGYFKLLYKTEKVWKNTVTVSYPGNTNFKAATATETFNVKITKPIKTYITLNKINDVNYGEETTISGYYLYGNGQPLTQTKMRININGKQYTTLTDDTGYFTFNYKTEKVWKNTVTVSYPGNKNFKAAKASEVFNVNITKPIDTYITLNKINEVKDGAIATISGYYRYGNGQPLTQTTMKININGNEYTAKTDKNGYFKYYYITKTEGINNVTVSYPGNTNFKAASKTQTFVVKANLLDDIIDTVKEIVTDTANSIVN